MSNSYESWKSVNEQIFKKKSRGKQVIVDPQSGKRQKISYKLQSDRKILIRLVRMLSIIDESGNLTQLGASALSDFMNSQMTILSSIPEGRSGINDNWYKKYFFIYTVLKDTQTRSDEGPAERGREKIQLTIVNRDEYKDLAPGAKFVNTKIIGQSTKESNPIISELISDNQKSVEVDDTPEGANIIVDDSDASDAKGTQETAILAGSKFRYTMRTNGKLYLMEFTENGALDASTVDSSDGPNGIISYEDPKIMWITEADQNVEGWKKGWSNNIPLSQDQEITNRIDKSFLTKMFTDSEFRNNTIQKYNEEFGASEITAENLRSMLYYSDGNLIFPESAGATASAATPVANVDTTSTYQAKNF